MYRVAVGYAVVSWVLVQVTAIVFPALELPAWTVPCRHHDLRAGFPVALILAWAFDIGPHGFEATAPALRHKIACRHSHLAAEIFICSLRSASQSQRLPGSSSCRARR